MQRLRRGWDAGFAVRGGALDVLLIALCLLSLAFVVFISGMVTNIANLFPSGYVRDAWRAGTALYEKRKSTHDYLTTDLWREERWPQRGVTVHDADRAQQGLTLYSSGHAATALLMDMAGTVVHQWAKPFSEVWDEGAVVREPVPDTQTYFRKVKLFPNGDLLAIYEGVGDTPYGYGMVKLDAASRVIWKNLDHHFHHSFDVDEAGRIYALSHGFRSDSPRNAQGYLADHLARPVLDDYLVILSPGGELIKRISLLDAMNDSPFRRLLWRVSSFSLEDPLHTNDVDLLDERAAASLAKKVPAARAGQVLLSFRELATGALALLDVEEERIVWVMQGQWMAQHDPDVTPEGNILMFDNLGDFGDNGQSRLIELDPASGGLVWSYGGDEQRPLDSDIRSEQALLDNGNVLVTDANPGRIFEVARSGEVVWEYINPVRKERGNGQRVVPMVAWAQRVDTDAFEPAFRTTTIQRLQLSEVNSP